MLERLIRTRGRVSVSSSLPDGVNEKKIEEKLGAVSLTSRPVKTGKGQFSKIREEDREAADLAFQ